MNKIIKRFKEKPRLVSFVGMFVALLLSFILLKNPFNTSFFFATISSMIFNEINKGMEGLMKGYKEPQKLIKKQESSKN